MCLVFILSRSHKGSALALLVELLAGAAVGAAVKDKMSEKSWGNLVVAVDPALLGDVEAFKASIPRWPLTRKTRSEHSVFFFNVFAFVSSIADFSFDVAGARWNCA